jgi:membrane-associated phospholipid phosphatase
MITLILSRVKLVERSLPAVLICSFLLIASGLLVPKGSVVLLFNAHHTIFLDKLCVWLDLYGNGWSFALFFLILCFIKYRWAIIAFTTWIIFSLEVLIFKELLFPKLVRPKNFFPDDILLNFVEGISTYGYHTFPSGHTTSAFAMTTLIWLFSGNLYLRILSLVFAITAGFSRIYLLQHFYVDVVAGIILGTVTSVLVYLFFSGRKLGELADRGMVIW